MRKVELSVEEKLRYRRKIDVVIPDEIDDDELGEILDDAQKEESLSDFMYVLKQNGIEAPEGYDDSLDSPWDTEIECDDYKFK